VPIIDGDDPTVLLTQRTAHLRDHAGQVSFPGGKIDASDESPAAAALREAEEEIALRRLFVHVRFWHLADIPFAKHVLAMRPNTPTHLLTGRERVW
jgi:8-oxo-dGTP pyrophosphatase MutT (NUDIX family)